VEHQLVFLFCIVDTVIDAATKLKDTGVLINVTVGDEQQLVNINILIIYHLVMYNFLRAIFHKMPYTQAFVIQ